MARFPFDLVAFDLDGTLADTAPDLATALNRVLEGLKRPAVDSDAVRDMVGYGSKALLRRGLALTGAAPEALVEETYPVFLDHYAANICIGTQPYPGLEAALDELAGRGVALAVCTNKLERLSRLLIDALGWRGRFAAIVGADTLPVSKPDPLPLREAIARAGGGTAAFVGDSIVDAETARAAGIPFVAVSFGFSDRAASELGADAVIDDYDDLVPTLERLSSASP
jgi:phosphoglycolate phosphatase